MDFVRYGKMGRRYIYKVMHYNQFIGYVFPQANSGGWLFRPEDGSQSTIGHTRLAAVYAWSSNRYQ